MTYRLPKLVAFLLRYGQKNWAIYLIVIYFKDPTSPPSSPIPLPIDRQSPQIDRGHHKGLEQIPSVTDIEIGPRGTELLLAEPVENEQRQIFHDYSRRNRIRRPVRVEMTNSKGKKGEWGHLGKFDYFQLANSTFMAFLRANFTKYTKFPFGFPLWIPPCNRRFPPFCPSKRHFPFSPSSHSRSPWPILSHKSKNPSLIPRLILFLHSQKENFPLTPYPNSNGIFHFDSFLRQISLFVPINY